MSVAGPSHSGGEEEEAEAAPGGSLSNFFDNSNVDATDLTFTDVLVDEPVPGESDEEDYPAGSSAIVASRRRRRGKKHHRRIVVSLVSCKYDVVAQAARALGWRCTIDENEEYNLLWNDSYVPFDTIAALNKYQKANHFPGMSELAKKNLLAKNLNRIAKALPGEFNFFPPTFILPGEAEPLKNWIASQVAEPLHAAPTLRTTPCSTAPRSEGACPRPLSWHSPPSPPPRMLLRWLPFATSAEAAADAHSEAGRGLSGARHLPYQIARRMPRGRGHDRAAGASRDPAGLHPSGKMGPQEEMGPSPNWRARRPIVRMAGLRPTTPHLSCARALPRVQYLPAPLLVDGYKFDMRLYA